MIVIICCVSCLTVIMLYHAKVKVDLTAPVLAGMSMITALGGAHTYKQGLIDKINKKTSP